MKDFQIRYSDFLILFLLFLQVSCSGQTNELNTNLGQLRTVQAEMTTKISDLQSNIDLLTGRVEELEYKLRGQTEQIERKLDFVSSRVPPPEGVPEDLLNSDEEALKLNTGQSATSYKVGLSQIRTGDFEAARQTFLVFIENNPNTAYTDNALFWTGITWELIDNYDRAIVAYNDAYQKFPAEDYAPVAIYQISECFRKMNDTNNMRLMLQKLIDEYPKSKYASLVRERLKVPKKSIKK
ncbi:MAG: tetratricopeptide repeat protein [Deltaproteobacteria bacterium]|jgi:tol-pal system protein YbgF|nr:tetratricopeptide repeat protein [Deltaproteobacteria bacterium]